MALQAIDDAINASSGLSLQALRYCAVMQDLGAASKLPDFSIDRLDELGAFVATEDFERVGPFKDAMNWSDYVAFLAAWMPTAEWDCSLRRITEHGNLVFVELEERLGADPADAVNSSSIYEFDNVGKVRHLDVYLQMAMPAG